MLVGVLLSRTRVLSSKGILFVLTPARALGAQFARSIEGDVLCFFNRAGMDGM